MGKKEDEKLKLSSPSKFGDLVDFAFIPSQYFIEKKRSRMELQNAIKRELPKKTVGLSLVNLDKRQLQKKKDQQKKKFHKCKKGKNIEAQVCAENMDKFKVYTYEPPDPAELAQLNPKELAIRQK